MLGLVATFPPMCARRNREAGGFQQDGGHNATKYLDGDASLFRNRDR